MVLRALYIEGFSPGPGLPSPILDRCGFAVRAPRMPYGAADVASNPFAVGLVGVVLCAVALLVRGPGALGSSAAAAAADSHLSPFAAAVLAVIFAMAVVALKRLAVGRTLDVCVETYRRAIASERPDIVIGYSWGGGIAAALLNCGHWDGATLLIAPAGAQMWSHAGRDAPTLRRGRIPPTAAVLTVQGEDDDVVPVDSSLALHDGADPAQCTLAVVSQGDHFLQGYVTSSTMSRWAAELSDRCDRVSAAHRARDEATR